MLSITLRSVWDEPRVPNAPVRVWRDWAIVGALLVSAVLEGTLRSDVIWRPVAIVLALGLVWALLWRRTRPLAMVTIVFGVLIAVSVASLVAGTEAVGLYTNAYILLLPYALFRWSSGRDVILGLPIIVVTYTLGIAADYTGVGDAIAGFLFGLFPAVLGALVRFLYGYQATQLERIKSLEREDLARDLHDTVAHHVSAIVVRAQAGRVVAPTDAQAAVDSLRIIEEEASRALTEMRLMVGTLREGEAAELAPQRGINDIARLANDAAASPPMTVELTGSLDDIRPSVGAVVYRLAQESITNARRHARHASEIDVRVDGDAQYVRLTVTDDGEPQPTAPSWSGYGLMGMKERAALLGGRLEAGPQPEGGWVVSAELPKGPAA